MPMSKRLKQVILLRKDLTMRKGKLIAQGSHASQQVLLQNMTTDQQTLTLKLSDHRLIADWLEQGTAKIALYVDSEEELMHCYHRARESGLYCALIKDSGRTEFKGIPTYTAAAIGPAYTDDIDPITSHLRLI